MSTLSDVQALYGSVRDTWAKSQAHVIAHVVGAIAVFGVCGATMPHISFPLIDPKQISDNEWFKLAKDTGIVYVSFLIPVVILAAYAALIRTGGQLLVSTLMLIWPPSPRAHHHRLLSSAGLEPLALTMEGRDFTFGDLQLKSSELLFKYQSQKNGQWEAFGQTIGKLTKNAQIYLGDFLLFLVIWTVLFEFLPNTNWIRVNATCYWPVVFLLATLAAFAWFRVFRSLAFIPALVMTYVSIMIRADPDMKSALGVSNEKRHEVREKLETLLQEERARSASTPSLAGFLKHKTRGRRATIREKSVSKGRGRPFPSFYQEGMDFSWDEKLYLGYDDEHWLRGYLAYVYYRAHRRIVGLARAFWQLIRYIVTGTP